MSPITVTAVQTGPVVTSRTEAVRQAFRSSLVNDNSPDLVVLPELFSVPFWCVGSSDPAYFDWAESLDGETLSVASEEARELDCYAIVPFFERGKRQGEFYNSAAVMAPDGSLVPGTFPGGDLASVYRKVAISAYNWGGAVNDEKYYFRAGAGFPVFDTNIGRIGVLICYDRWFPEAWRVLALGGAEIICVTNASSGAASDLFVPSMRTWATENVVHVVGVNRAGSETVDGVTTSYYGLSCVVAPTGELLDVAPEGAPGLATASIDIADVGSARINRTMYRDRRPDLYRSLSQE